MQLSQAVRDVLAERERQRAKGYTADHDKDHTPAELGRAAASYADPRIARFTVDGYFVWPFGDGFKPRGTRENLVRAAALALAAVERYDAHGAGPAGGV